MLDELAAEVGAPADLAVLLLAGLDFPDEEDAYPRRPPAGWARRSSSGTTPMPSCGRAASGWGVAVTCGWGISASASRLTAATRSSLLSAR